MHHHRGAAPDAGHVNELTSEYESALQELTFNSKPHINNLTIIAGENMPAAEHIVALVEQRLFNAPRDQKLPSLYLLDSIVKNIGGVYHELFQRNIVSIFRTTYEAVDEPTRASMRRLLATWVALWPRKVQLIHDRIPSAALPGAAPGAAASTASNAGRGIHINPAYLAKLQGASARPSGPPSSSRRSPPPPRHSISPPPSSSSHRRDHPARSPPRKRGRSPPRYGPSGGGGSYKSARRSPPDRVSEILGHTPGGRPHRGEPEGRGAYRPRPSDSGGRFGGARPDDPRRPAPDHRGPPQQHPMPSAPNGNPLAGMPGAPGGYGPPLAAMPQPLPLGGVPAGAPGGGHQAILAEAQVLMQQLEQRLQTQLGQSNVDHSEVMRQLGQLRALQQQASHILTQPGQPIPMAAPTQAAPAPNLVQNLQGLGQGQQARESILSLLQGALASSLPPTVLSPPTSQPMGLPTAPVGAFAPGAPAPYAPHQAPIAAPAGISPPPSAMPMATEDLLKNLMSMGMIGGPGTGMAASSAPPMDQMPPFSAGGMPPLGMAQPAMPGMMPAQPMPGMPPMGMPAGYPPQGGMPGLPMAAAGMARPYPGAGGLDAAHPPKRRRLDLATDNAQVNKLYADFEMQCGTCGLRFNDKDKMAKHLDWHFAMNKKEKQKTKKAVSRLWFSTAEEWATGIDVTEKPAMPFFEAAAEETAETPVMNVIADESQPNCGICSEKFDQFWDNELEEWMYRATVKVEGTGQLFHQKCYEQAVAMNQAQQQQQQQQQAADTTSSDGATSSVSSSSSSSSSSSTSSASQFWVKKEPEGEGATTGGAGGEGGDGGGASRDNNANDTTTLLLTSPEGSRASA